MKYPETKEEKATRERDADPEKFEPPHEIPCKAKADAEKKEKEEKEKKEQEEEKKVTEQTIDAAV